MGNGALKEPHSYVKKGDRLALRISHLEPEKRRVGFTQRWGTDPSGPIMPVDAAPEPAAEKPQEDAAPPAAAEEVPPEPAAEKSV
jgi:uncharacterized membrane protein